MQSLSQIISWIAVNPWLTILSFIVTLFSHFLAIFFYLKGKLSKMPCYTKRSINIFRNFVSRIEHLKIIYINQPIENLTITKILFWNRGCETINRQDIPQLDPLTIRVKNGLEILDAKITYVKNPANQFSLIFSDDNSWINLEFDYVDKDEGAIVQVMHTGTSESDVQISGTIKGVGKLKHKPWQDINFIPLLPLKLPLDHLIKVDIPIKTRRYIVAVIFFIFPLIISTILFLPPPGRVGEFSFFTKLLISMAFIILYWLMGFHTLRRTIPKGFSKFEEEL